MYYTAGQSGAIFGALYNLSVWGCIRCTIELVGLGQSLVLYIACQCGAVLDVL